MTHIVWPLAYILPSPVSQLWSSHSGLPHVFGADQGIGPCYSFRMEGPSPITVVWPHPLFRVLIKCHLIKHSFPPEIVLICHPNTSHSTSPYASLFAFGEFINSWCANICALSLSPHVHTHTYVYVSMSVCIISVKVRQVSNPGQVELGKLRQVVKWSSSLQPSNKSQYPIFPS